MRYLCHIGFSFAAALLLCAYGFPAGWQLPAAMVLAAAGFAASLLRRRREKRFLLRLCLCLLGAALGFGVYAAHWTVNILPARALHGRTVTATVELRETPAETRYGSSALGWMELDGRRWPVLCYLDADEDGQPGDRITGSFRLKEPSAGEDGTEPGYLRSCGVYLTASLTRETARVRPARLPLRYWPAMVRRRVAEACGTLFSDQTAPWFVALLTNQSGGMSYADKNALKLAGLYHCICTSGMHISVLLGAVSLLCLRRKRLCACIGLPVCLFFWAVAGGTPSVSRAVVMQSLLLLAPLLLRESDAPTSMALALTVILLRRPDSVAHLGLQLSFLSVGGIELASGRIYQWMTGRREHPNWLLHGVASSLSTALGALLLTTPLLARQYGVLSLVAPLAGLLCLTAVTVCFAAGLPVALLGLAAPQVAAVAAMPLELLMRYVIAVTRVLASLPAVYLSSPYWIVWLALAYGLLLLLWLGRSRPATVIVCLCASCCLTLLLHRMDLRRGLPEDGFRLTVLDVGQGQCLVLQAGTEVCVIDCGGSWPEDAGETCARYLLAQGVRRIDLLVLTHYHADHAGGVPQLLSRVPAGRLILPEVPDDTGNRAAVEPLAAAEWITEDTAYALGSGVLTVYAPRSLADDNEACLSVAASFGEDAILVTGDMDAQTELRLCKTAALPDVAVYIAGHHGSRDASGAYLLRQIRPEVVIVSAGADSRYGHPHAETLARCEELGSLVLCTAELGNITIER